MIFFKNIPEIQPRDQPTPFEIWKGNRKGWPRKYYQDTEDSGSEDESTQVLSLEDLLLGPDHFDICYEYWEQLAQQYLRDPNRHTPSILEARAKGEFGIPEEEIINCLQFY